MQKINIWIEESQNYETIAIPDSWRITYLEIDTDALCNCASCGKQIKYGDSYTSLYLHTESGFGYAVCHDCYYDIELPKRFNSSKEL